MIEFEADLAQGRTFLQVQYYPELNASPHPVVAEAPAVRLAGQGGFNPPTSLRGIG